MIYLQQPRFSGSAGQQLQQLQDYLQGLIPRLNLMLEQLSAREQTQAGTPALTPQAQRAQAEQKAAETFASVKALIIKSADIVKAYSEQIRLALAGEYVAQGEFGAYKEQTELALTLSSQNVEALFTDSQQLSRELEEVTAQLEVAEGSIDGLIASADGLSDRVVAVQAQAQATQQQTDQIQAATDALTEDTENLMETTGQMSAALQDVVATNMDIKAYIRMGKLGTEGGIDIYGIEIGQDVEINDSTVFSKFMRLSSGKLVFYNADGSVAAMASGDRLLCPQLEAEKLYLGGFSFLPRTNGNLSVRWTG